MPATKKISCFFVKNSTTIVLSKDVDVADPNCECKAIESVIKEHGINPYNLFFVVDDNIQTYRAEYLHSLYDFRSRSSLLKMETEIKKTDNQVVVASYVARRVAIRNMSESDWIDKHASGTLRKNKRIGFSYRIQYLAERIAYEFGYGFEILPRSQITFGDPITEGDCHSITEAGWHIERYMSTNVFGDRVEAKYINASYRDNSVREGVGMVIRETSASWIPTGHIIFSIVAEFDPIGKRWKNAINPF